ncbi:MAG: methylated-DNA--[protein]-cysteine S-methyltransferase [Clostridia bacterium]|nr:methylated-DNA--[protein]-cysteine S-methyltransferase [Clostridia bacterium]MDR3645705.1 methylated-DNA--[protein]-cysteine S-methyltransferase [Clostridia bacterium]
MEIYSGELQTPFGKFSFYCGDNFIIRLLFEDDNTAQAMERMKKQLGEFVLCGENAMTRRCACELAAYFSGSLRQFTLPCRLEGTEFEKKVWRALMKIPYGSTVSYAQLGMSAGVCGPRAVGNAVGKNPLPVVIPCHRVIHADGSLGGFSSGLHNKVMLLRLEGVPVKKLKIPADL